MDDYMKPSNGRRLTNLKFSDDFVLILSATMLKDLYRKATRWSFVLIHKNQSLIQGENEKYYRMVYGKMD